jgi:hypothetical protein
MSGIRLAMQIATRRVSEQRGEQDLPRTALALNHSLRREFHRARGRDEIVQGQIEPFRATRFAWIQFLRSIRNHERLLATSSCRGRWLF